MCITLFVRYSLQKYFLHVKKNVSYNLHVKKVGEYLREKREAREMSFREAATASGLSHVHVKDIEDGKKAPSFDKVMSLLKAYHADVQEFLRETGYLPVNVEPAELPKTRQVPLVSWVIAGKWEEARGAFQSGDVEAWIDTDIKGADIFALTVKGDSMEPEFQEGDTVIVNPHIKPDHNDYVVVRNEEDEATFKQLKKFGKERVLHPLNPNYEDIRLSETVQYKIVGKVVQKIKTKRY